MLADRQKRVDHGGLGYVRRESPAPTALLQGLAEETKRVEAREAKAKAMVAEEMEKLQRVAGMTAAAVIGAAFGLVYLWRPEAMGFGDVRLAMLTAGTVGWGADAIAAAFAAVLVASLGASVVMLVTRTRSLPFAPFLVPAVAIALG